MAITLGPEKSYSYYNSWDIIARILIVCISFTLMPVTSYAQFELIKNIPVTESSEGGSARPELVVTADRVFVVYLGNISSGSNRTFNLKIFNKDLDTVILSKILVSTTEQFGGPTDIRVASDGQYLYAFYETNKSTSPATATTYLWAAKYTLNDSFDRVIYTTVPIANSKPMAELQDGGELVDDPAPLIGPNSIFVVTRLKYSIAKAGKTTYKVREFNQSDLRKLSEFNLDLSDAADGRARVTSLFFGEGSIFIALATTVSDEGINENNDDGAMSDIVLVKMKQDWTFDPAQDIRNISAESNDRENYITGLRADNNFSYVTYKQSVGSPPNGEHRAIIKIFDKNFNLLHNEIVKTTGWGPNGGELRPSIEVFGNHIFSGQSGGQGLGSGNAEIYLYENHLITVIDQNVEQPNEYYLSQNYPNPFNPTTVISFQLPVSGHVRLTVFDVLGREVATLVNGELNAGEHSVQFDGKNLPSGIYIYRLQAGSIVHQKKMTVLK